MATDPDLSAHLPPAPPPRPDRREDTISRALQRFDGEAPAVPPRAARRWRFAGRPELGALAAAALIAAIGLPLWLSDEYRPQQTSGSPAVVIAPPPPAAAEPKADVVPAPVLRAQPSRAPGVAAAPARQSAPATLDARQLAEIAATALPAPPPPAFAPPPPPVITPTAPPAPPPPPPPAAPALRATDRAESIGDVIVTGSRIAGGDANKRQADTRTRSTRDGWNACTVDDPRRDVNACSADLSGGGALVQQGLARAWQGDMSGAIAEFDRALALSPRLAPAWLNRGLAYARAGDDGRARADLDKAVRYAPDDPRGWYQRSLVLRRLGKTARADADAARAARLDPH